MTGAFIGDDNEIVSVEMSGKHWYYVREALMVQVPELYVLSGLQAAGAGIPGNANFSEWAACLQDAADAIFTACSEAPSSIHDPTLEDES